MRLPTALSIRTLSPLRTALPAAALALAPALYGLGAHAAAAEPAPTCGDGTASDFPIETRLRGGPDHYARGAGWQQWHLELRNTTDAGCRAVHPVAVLVDQGHALRPRQIQLEFLDPYADGGTWRDVSFQTTDEDENVGVFEKDFKGFTVAAGKTVDVRIRTRFTTDAPLGPVTANAIAVQRRADDGGWVGQSNDYAFRIAAGAEPGGDSTAGADNAPVPAPVPDTKPSAEPEPSVEPEPEPSAGLESEPSAGLEPVPSAEPEPETEAEHKAEPAEPRTEPSPAPTRRLERSPVAVPPSPDSETDQGTEDSADSGTDEDLGVDTDLGTGTDEAGTDEADTEADPGTDADTETGTDTETDPGTETGTETGTDPGYAAEDPAAEDPATEDPATEDPATEDPATEDPAAEDPGSETGTEDPGSDTTDPEGTDPGKGDDRHDEDGARRHEHWKPELAATGERNVRLAGLGVISVGLVAGGTALVVKSRRARR